MPRSEMNCIYALRDEGRVGVGMVTLCDCPGGCKYKKETTKTGRGIVGECTKIVGWRGEDDYDDYYTAE